MNTGTPKLAMVRNFFDEHDVDIQNAAILLGGAPALRRVQRLRGRIARSRRFSTVIRHELNWLHDLVSLERVDDPFSEEAGFFAEACCDDEAIVACCLLAEQLSEVIEALAREPAGQEEARHAA